eukprot:m.420728 g.420728  ORF g.420728 m.420728 type:complete len:632 (-) comp32778_c0_seq1:231-2126(-)
MSFLRRKSMSKSGKRVHRTSTGKEFPVGAGARPTSIISTNSGKAVTWEDCVPQPILETLLSRERQRQKVIFELTKTEGDYLNDLATLRDLFRASLVQSESIPLTKIAALFSNLDDVILTNEELFERLAKRPVKGVVEGCVADIFIDVFSNDRFDSYLDFCANQLPASELYGDLLKESPKFVEIMRACAGKTGGFDLPAFLLKGMQRLLKYNPLLGQIKKRTRDSDYAALALLDRAMELVNIFGKKVNKRLGDSENARRLPKIQERLVYDPSTRWVGAKELDLNLVGDPSRKLVHEGRLQYIRPQAPGSTEVRTDSVYVFILSDMVLLTAERDGKYMLISKDPIPVIYLGAVVDFRAEITLPERVRSTLCIEINEGDIGEADVEPDHGRDGPRRILPVTQKTFVRLLAPSQKQLQVWIQALRDTRRRFLQAESELQRSSSHASSQHDEYAVTMLVSSSSTSTDTLDAATSTTDGGSSAAGSSAVHFPNDDSGDGVADWAITFVSTTTSGEAVSEVTRSIRLVQGSEGLGFTLIGRAPVQFQEVEMGSPAWRAGIRVGHKIRAVNGHECTNAAHHEVVVLIREALAAPVSKPWIPVSSPLHAIQEGDAESLGSLGRNGRSLRKALLSDPSEIN